MSSVDGEHWETKVEALRYDLTNIVWYDNKFNCHWFRQYTLHSCIRGRKNVVARGPKDASYSVTPLCITWNGEKLVAAGYDSTILTAVPKDIVKVKVNDRPIVLMWRQ